MHYDKEMNLDPVVELFSKLHPRRLELHTLFIKTSSKVQFAIISIFSLFFFFSAVTFHLHVFHQTFIKKSDIPLQIKCTCTIIMQQCAVICLFNAIKEQPVLSLHV